MFNAIGEVEDGLDVSAIMQRQGQNIQDDKSASFIMGPDDITVGGAGGA